MKKGIRLVCLALLLGNLIIINPLYSQPVRYKCTNLFQVVKDSEREIIGVHKAPDLSSEIVIINPSGKKIRTYSQYNSFDLDIIDSVSVITTIEGNIAIKYICVDKQGKRCNARLVHFTDDKININNLSMFVDYSDYTYWYQLVQD